MKRCDSESSRRVLPTYIATFVSGMDSRPAVDVETSILGNRPGDVLFRCGMYVGQESYERIPKTAWGYRFVNQRWG